MKKMILKMATVAAAAMMFSATAMAEVPKGLSLAVETGVNLSNDAASIGTVVMYKGIGMDIYTGARTNVGVDLRLNLLDLAAIVGPSRQYVNFGVYGEIGCNYYAQPVGYQAPGGSSLFNMAPPKSTPGGGYSSVTPVATGGGYSSVTQAAPGGTTIKLIERRDTFALTGGGGLTYKIPVSGASFDGIVIGVGYHTVKGINGSVGIYF